jgi:hypothetical protein
VHVKPLHKADSNELDFIDKDKLKEFTGNLSVRYGNGWFGYGTLYSMFADAVDVNQWTYLWNKTINIYGKNEPDKPELIEFEFKGDSFRG